MRVLLVEDEPNVAGFIMKGFIEESLAVDHARTVADGSALAVAKDYDLLVLDRRLPDGDGLDIVRRLRTRGSTTPILLLSVLGDVEDRVKGLECGADDYLVKPFEFVELLARTRALLRRGRLPLPSVLRCGDIELDPAAHRILVQGQRLDLPPREFALLDLFLRYPGAALSRTRIGEHVWDYRFGPESNAIDVAIGRLRRRLEEAGSRTVIETVRGVGYALVASSS
jgi:two-component system, OmpR family, response regulator